MEERWTSSGVRLRRASLSPGRWNWLLVPGGPGLGSESLAGLVDPEAMPGTVWLVDLPGDGSNQGFSGPQVVRRTVEGAGHFPWIENPAAVRDALAAVRSR
ncbi:pimeloyl-ACP methyl ester carboxylesterase [Streptacidiphilus sp. MAP12-33]|uniref:hypothetical protein n=1 Tax=Streptacidiphilus sp. MAP12-33 TaxID=3156266 RepID=UPI003517103C